MRSLLDPTRTLAHGVAIIAVMLGTLTTAQAADAYVLSVSDRLTIKVVEWKAAQSTFEEWTALAGEYVIGADGTLNFPMLGAAPGAGKTTAELSEAIGTGLQQTLGLTTAPTVTVEVAQYGPIYVSGDVGSPGEYPFAPNLTVVKALALAGGERRSAEASNRPEREMLTTTGQLDVLQDDYSRQLVRRARLDAQLAGNTELTLPADLEGLPEIESVLAAEQAIMSAQARQEEAQSTSLADEVSLLTSQIEAYRQKQASAESQLETARDQLSKITQLSEDGLAISSRVTSLQTAVADLESRLLDTQTAMLQAQQSIAAAEREQARLVDERLSALSLERQTADGEIAALALKIGTQRGLVQEAALYTGLATPGGTQPSYSYSIIRNGEELAADAYTPIMAGDVVMARIVLATDPTLASR